MSVTVVTGFREDGYDLYGREFIESFNAHWPESVDLWVYAWEPVDPGRGKVKPVPQACRQFVSKHEHNPAARGRKYLPNMRWKPAEIENGYCYRYDAWKFAQMAFYVADAASRLSGILVWLDADVVTHEDVPEGFIEEILDDDDLAFLGRRNIHSETGFIAFRLPEASCVAEWWAESYSSARVFDLSEWHSAYVFDVARTRCLSVRERNLTPRGSGHVWFQSCLSAYMDHKKGDWRKVNGRSNERKDDQDIHRLR